MKEKLSLFLMLLIFLGCKDDSVPEKVVVEQPYNKADYSISNEVLQIGISNRMAGAVCTMIFDGEEFVNDRDHGRQMQVAWIYNDLDEAYNPTEAGSSHDGTGRSTTSELLSVDVAGNKIITSNNPAYWLSQAPASFVNTSVVTNDLLTKEITLGYNGDLNVLVYDTKIELSTNLTGPEIESLRIEAPTIYSSPKLTEHYLYDLEADTISLVPKISNFPDRMNEHIRFASDRNIVPIMASPDGNLAISIYAPVEKDFWAYYTWDIPSSDPINACTKITSFYKHTASAGETYNYKGFVVCGNFDTVKSSLKKLKVD